MDFEIGEWTQGTLPWNVKTSWDSERGIIRAGACCASRLVNLRIPMPWVVENIFSTARRSKLARSRNRHRKSDCGRFGKVRRGFPACSSCDHVLHEFQLGVAIDVAACELYGETERPRIEREQCRKSRRQPVEHPFGPRVIHITREQAPPCAAACGSCDQMRMFWRKRNELTSTDHVRFCPSFFWLHVF